MFISIKVDIESRGSVNTWIEADVTRASLPQTPFDVTQEFLYCLFQKIA